MSDSDDFLRSEYEGLLHESQSREERDEKRKETLGLLLQNEAILEGMEAADTRIADYHSKLTEQGKHVYPVADGVTLDGDRVIVAEYADVPNPKTVANGDWDSWHKSHKYSVFVYDLQGVATPGAAQEVSERQVQKVMAFRGNVSLTIEDPGSESGTAGLHLPAEPDSPAQYNDEFVYPIRKG